MYTHRRSMAIVLVVVALAAVTAFALGVTLCIDWGGAGAPPGEFLRHAALLAGGR